MPFLNMLLQRNLLENLMILSSCGTITCILLNYITNISLITGVWFPLYVLTLFIVSVLLSFKCIQWLLHLNKPLKYDRDALLKSYPHLAFLKNYLPDLKKPVAQEWKEYDTNELSVISTVLERNLVSSWYLPYVSQDIAFPFACKQMLDQMIGNAFKVCHKIESKDVFIDMCIILITHFKEYKKALKWHEKNPDQSIQTLYHKSHPTSNANNKYTTADHCTNIVRILMKELIPNDLWDTPHSELLVRILSKKLDTYIENTIADPIWINDRIVTYLTGEENVEPEVNKEAPEQVPEKLEPASEPTFQVEAAEEFCPTDTMKMEPIVEEHATNIPPLDIKSSPVLRQKRGRQGRNEVKIYDRIIEGSVKTWETDMDLQCISLGQDLLASLDGEITLSRLWGQDGEAESSPERQGGRSPQPLWFGEEEALELEEGTTGNADARHSPRASDVLRELSHTVTSAKTRIGDLQDEAAGMMEGLLDFGIAGLKKGLRFTGLSDDSQDKSPSHREKSDRISPEGRHRTNPEPIPSITQKDGDASNGAAPHLVKQHRVTSQDSVPIPRSDPITAPVPAPLCDSPEPQYEEAADLSSSIAKLRCLLRQRDPPREEEVWWEGAEETRGRATHHLPSERAVDTATLADEYDMSLERSASPNQAANNMQRLDKLFQRTVTGVFNSLKTAVGGEDPAAPATAWSVVAAARSAPVARLLAARNRARPARVERRVVRVMRAPRDADDLDECGGAWSALLGAAGAACAVPHAAARLATLLLSELVEVLVCQWLSELGAALRARAFSGAPRAARARPHSRPLADLLMERTTALQILFGRETVRSSIAVAVGSVSHACITRDLAYRALDILARHARVAAGDLQ